MKVAHRIEVTEYDESCEPRVLRVPCPEPSSINRDRLVGLAGTLALHGLAASLLIPSPLTHKPSPPESVGVPSPAIHPAAEDELVIVNITGPKRSDSDATSLDLRAQLTKFTIPLVVPDPRLAINLPRADTDTETENFAQSATDVGDAETRARMFGRYTGQISARIERAWQKPESPVNDLSTGRTGDGVDPDTFVCQVQIRQDNRGNVQEVLLLACNGTEAWRHSLVVAINQSSPLPAPPIPTVFRRAVTMTFDGRVDREEARPKHVEPAPQGESP